MGQAQGHSSCPACSIQVEVVVSSTKGKHLVMQIVMLGNSFINNKRDLAGDVFIYERNTKYNKRGGEVVDLQLSTNRAFLCLSHSSGSKHVAKKSRRCVYLYRTFQVREYDQCWVRLNLLLLKSLNIQTFNISLSKRHRSFNLLPVPIPNPINSPHAQASYRHKS
jgi:hypothetical protein